MADDDQEKTEEATPKKIEDAKKDGNVPKSQDLAGFVTLVIAIGVLLAMLNFMKEQIISLYIYYSKFIGQPLTLPTVKMIVVNTFARSLLMILPVCICVAIAGVIANVMQFGFIFTTKPIMPNFGKINPLKGLKNLFSMKKVIDSIKIVLKVSIVFGVGFYFFLQFIKELPHTLFFSMFDQLAWLKEKLIILVSVMLFILFVIGLIDLLIVRFQYFKDLRMSKQEIKDEYKELMNAKVYIDSPLATSATDIFKENMELFDENAQKRILNGDNPIDFEGLVFTKTPDESKALNTLKEPHIIVSASRNV